MKRRVVTGSGGSLAARTSVLLGRRILAPGLLGVALLAPACGGREPESVTLEAVEVAVTPSAEGPAIASYPATVVSERSAVVATRAAGTVREVPADVGSVVGSGAALVRLDGADVEARVASAEAALTLARQYHQRIAALERDGAATGQELDEATRGLQQAKAALAEAEAQRRYVVLRAPFAGVIVSRMVDPGDLAAPGTPLLKLSGLTGLEIEADLPGQLRGVLAVGDTVRIVAPEIDLRSLATVTRVVPALEAGTQRFRVEARFGDEADPLPLPGTVVRIEFALPGRPVVWVPPDAIVRRGQLRGVFTIETDSLRLRWVRLGQERSEAVEVLAGLDPLEPVVRSPDAGLLDGQPVAAVSTVGWRQGGVRE